MCCNGSIESMALLPEHLPGGRLLIKFIGMEIGKRIVNRAFPCPVVAPGLDDTRLS
jgi:hypothetical protein